MLFIKLFIIVHLILAVYMVYYVDSRLSVGAYQKKWPVGLRLVFYPFLSATALVSDVYMLMPVVVIVFSIALTTVGYLTLYFRYKQLTLVV